MSSFSLPDECPDCRGSLREVTVYAQGSPSMIGGYPGASILHYTSPEAKPGFLHGRLRSSGEIHSLICLNCRRVFQYAVPNDSDTDGDKCLQCGQSMELTERCSHCGWSYVEHPDEHERPA